MASPVGGQFKFTDGVPVHLGLKSGTTVSPGPITGDLNIEAVVGGTILPPLATGFKEGVIVRDTVAGDAPPHLIGSGTSQLLTGRQLTLFGGAYTVTDTNKVSGNTARITATTGNQTVVGASGDTLIGGTGAQSLVGSLGHQSIVGGSKTYSVRGGFGDTIKASTGATLITAGHVSALSSNESIQIGKAGHYTVSAGASSTITSAAGVGNAKIATGKSDLVNLNGNKGAVTVTAGLSNTVIAGRGVESIRGAGGDRIGVGSGATVGGTLKFSRGSLASPGDHFGTNDTVHSTTYNTKTGTATRHTTTGGTSSAHVTVTNFRLGTDSLFYKGETSTLNKDIVLTAHNVTGGVKIILPDGTTMTLLGHTASQLVAENNAHLLFKL